jgi:hypothetical protein
MIGNFLFESQLIIFIEYSKTITGVKKRRTSQQLPKQIKLNFLATK